MTQSYSARFRTENCEKKTVSKKVSITLDDEVLEFVDQLASDRSSCINNLLLKEKERIFMMKLANDYKEQSNELEFQEEVAAWNVTVSDGLNA
jgi:hypothetical protein